jgi:hypothetical protein
VLRDAVAAWQARLLPLAGRTAPVMPSPQVWRRIERQLFGEPAAPPRWWQRLVLWRGAAAFATVAALGLALLLAQPQPVSPPIVIVLNANPDARGVQPVSFVASVTPDGRALVLKPLGAVPLDAPRRWSCGRCRAAAHHGRWPRFGAAGDDGAAHAAAGEHRGVSRSAWSPAAARRPARRPGRSCRSDGFEAPRARYPT